MLKHFKRNPKLNTLIPDVEPTPEEEAKLPTINLMLENKVKKGKKKA